MNEKNLFSAFCIVFLTVTACDKNSRGTPAVINNKITPNTMHPVVTIEADTPQRVQDLSALAYALEKYKQDYQQYPISSNSGRGYDGLYANEKYGESRTEWITGLVPHYIEKLPRDPRNDTVIFHSYLYISNGANYKLIVQRPADCQEVKAKYPSLIDPQRDCYAYGYWTGKAVNW